METGSSSSSTRPILKSTAKLSTSGSGLVFKNWSYVTTTITFDLTTLLSLTYPNGSIYLDTGCGVTLIDRNWLAKKLSSQKISAMLVFLKVRGVGASKHESEDFAFTTIYISSIDKKGREVYASISCKLHLIEGLKANILMDNNLLCTKGFAINFSTSSALIHSCDMKIDIIARQNSGFLRQKVLAGTLTIVPSCSEALVAFQHIELSYSRDFLFHPSSQQHLTLYSHFFDHTSTKILVRNNTNYIIKILLYHRLGCITKLPHENCFATLADLDIVSMLPTLLTIFYDRNGISIPPTGDLETKLPNGIKIYKDKQAVDAITCLVNEYLSIGESLEFVQIPSERWMKVHPKLGWETKTLAIKTRVYLLGIKAKRLVDERFDKMQRLSRLKYITSHTSFSFLMFVVYKTNAKKEKKGHTVVNIRKLNDLLISDAYSLPLQLDIISSVQEYTNLAVLNAASFFYHLLLDPDHWYMFNVVTH